MNTTDSPRRSYYTPVSPSHSRKPSALLLALTLLAAQVPLLTAAELGAMTLRSSWPNTASNFSTYDKGGTGIVTQSAADSAGMKAHGSASFHTLSGSCSGSSDGSGPSGPSGKPSLGGRAYWFDQITISAPGIATGTIGTADFTLFFNGNLSAGPSVSYQSSSYQASINYRWAADADTADGQPDINVGDSYTRLITVFSASSETTGTEFLNQPRQHTLTFRYGVPFDFTVSVNASATYWRNIPCKVATRVSLSGWNGFGNFQIRDVGPASNVVVDSQTGFNYGNAGTTSFEQWAKSFQAPPLPTGDDNANGLTNLAEFALGRDPQEAATGSPFTAGQVIDGGVTYPTFSFTRPTLGARPDVIYTPQRSISLLDDSWSTTGLIIDTTPAGPQSETITVRSTSPVPAEAAQWLRLQVTKP